MPTEECSNCAFHHGAQVACDPSPAGVQSLLNKLSDIRQPLSWLSLEQKSRCDLHMLLSTAEVLAARPPALLKW